ncbi:hypothetical protein D3C85_1460630 [compost metagenome]
MHATAMADCSHGLPSPALPAGASKAASASSGTMARSSSSRMETMRCPCALAVSSRSPRICITMAVDDSTKPIAAMNAAGPDNPASNPTAVNSPPQASTCATPRPKISPRSFHKREGCISRPIMKRNITTPSSATCRMDLGSEKKPMPNGPMTRPAAR